ncbi:Pilus assembly protein, PilO [Photobacterium damselae subsp. piscicida]|uniref:Pilus assembly protein, PilO n=1 Tax=Photobacterium damsela subsp. piscicida TaxID=38294 RepID=A0AAD1CJ06_PHODP|nr:type 4a pilus biogenesis protein PilO [Photobacterium damselae]MDP2544445.1 type 4a pilus biogenesis protein PilO [Photobacterium damselae subsp. piscicida]BAX54401.1 Pilus assembly protein, PilO [Photobacterium damselae subsp. piscicida]
MKEWQDLDLDEMADWPLLPQCLVALLLTGLLIAVGYWYWYWYWYWLTPKSEQLAQIKQQEVELKMRLTNRASQVAALPIMKEQIEELNRRYDKVMKQLPVEKELATLLAGINDIGVRSGLEFQSIEWAPIREQEWYYELPINMQLQADGSFCSIRCSAFPNRQS